MVTAIDVGELERRARDVLRRVREDGEAFDVVEDGLVLVRLVPAGAVVDDATRQAIIERRRQLIEDISRAWPEDGPSAAEAVAEQRRER